MHNNSLALFRQIPTADYHGYGLEFSPILKNNLAVAAAENFGIKGSGAVLLYDLSNSFSLTKILRFAEGLFDLAWSLTNPHVIISCSSDGQIQTWNTASSNIPINVIKAHEREISSIKWSLFNPQIFCSASWDHSIKIWDAPSNSKISELRNHQEIIYDAKWSTMKPDGLLSASGDGTLSVWEPSKSPAPCLTIEERPGSEVLSCDWSKCYENIIASASTDSSINVWDLRFPNNPLHHLTGHNSPVRRLLFSPVIADELLSVSYDFTTKLWNFSDGGKSLSSRQDHSEFVYNVAYDPIQLGRVADVSWDRNVNLYQIGPKIQEAKVPFGPSNNTMWQNKIHTSPFAPNNNSLRPLPQFPPALLTSKL